MPTADQVALRNATRQIAQQLAGMDKRLSAVERGPQLAHSSVQDADGNDMPVVTALRAGLDAQAAANGLNAVFYNPTTDPPAGGHVGDTWFPPDDGYAPRRWDGTAWQPFQLDTQAFAANSITAGLIDAGAVTADKLAAILVLASKIMTGAPTGARIEITPDDGIVFFGDSGNPTVSSGALREFIDPNGQSGFILTAEATGSSGGTPAIITGLATDPSTSSHGLIDLAADLKVENDLAVTGGVHYGDDTGWLDLVSLQNGFTVPSGKVAQARLRDGVVRLRGYLLNSSFTGGWTTGAALPATIPGPPTDGSFALGTNSSVAHQRAAQLTASSQDIDFYSDAASGAFFGLDGISYLID